MGSEQLVFGPERGRALSVLEEGTRGVVVRVDADNGSRVDGLMPLGVIPGAAVKILHTFPRVVFLCDQMELVADHDVADLIFVKPEDDW